MDRRGFIAVSRAVWDHHAFPEEPMSQREAWLWMLNEAVWKGCKVRGPHGPIELQRGQFSHSLRFMAKRFGWSVNKLRRVLRGYADEHMLVLENSTATNTAQLVITICNYDKYQNGETATNTASDTEADTTVDTLTDTKNEQVTNNNTKKEPKGSKKISPLSHEDLAFSIFSQEVEGSGISIPRKLTPDRKSAISARLRDYDIDVWREACQKLAASSFCRGENDKGWKADFDFLCSPKGFNKILEGRYDDRAAKQPAINGHHDPPLSYHDQQRLKALQEIEEYEAQRGKHG